MFRRLKHVTEVRSNIEENIRFGMLNRRSVYTGGLRMKDLPGNGKINIDVHKLKECLRCMPELEIHALVNGKLELILLPVYLLLCVRITFNYICNGGKVRLTVNGLREQKWDFLWRIRCLQYKRDEHYAKREGDSHLVWINIGKAVQEGEEIKEKSAVTVATEINSMEEIDVANKAFEKNENDPGTLLSPSSPVSSGSDSSYDDGKLLRRQARDRTASDLNYQGSSMVEEQSDKVVEIMNNDINGEFENWLLNTLIGYSGEQLGSPERNYLKGMEEFRQSEISVLQDGFVAFTFSSLGHLNEVLEKDQLFLKKDNNRPLILKRWSPDDPVYESSLFLSSLPIWVRFYNINWTNWTKEYLREVSRDIGEFLYMDKSTAERKRFDFARVCIEVDPFKELPDKVHVAVGDKSIPIKVDYEWKPEICRHCISLSHDSTSCRLASEEVNLRREDSYVSSIEELRSLANNAGDHNDDIDNLSFGVSATFVPEILGDGELEQERLNNEANWLRRIVTYFSEARPSFRNTSRIERSVSL